MKKEDINKYTHSDKGLEVMRLEWRKEVLDWLVRREPFKN